MKGRDERLSEITPEPGFARIWGCLMFCTFTKLTSCLESYSPTVNGSQNPADRSSCNVGPIFSPNVLVSLSVDLSPTTSTLTFLLRSSDEGTDPKLKTFSSWSLWRQKNQMVFVQTAVFWRFEMLMLVIFVWFLEAKKGVSRSDFFHVHNETSCLDLAFIRGKNRWLQKSTPTLCSTRSNVLPQTNRHRPWKMVGRSLSFWVSAYLFPF